MLRQCVLPLILLGTGMTACAQQPFFTDDADVTPKGHFHFELSNQLSFLQNTAFPSRRQNALVYQLNYGLPSGLELGVDSPYLAIINARETVSPRIAAGVGDTNVTVKWNFHREQERSSIPALTIAYAIEAPTGDTHQQLGSGLFDYRLSVIAQKTLVPGTTLRVNQGVLFAGNTLTGVVGLRGQGVVYQAGASLVRRFTPRLSLGMEINGAWAPEHVAERAALQQQVGGKYAIQKNLTIDFGILVGQLGQSPRVALQVGLSKDF